MNWSCDSGENSEPIRPPLLEEQATPTTQTTTTASSSATIPKRNKANQLAHAERLRKYEGPERTEECRKNSIEFFSKCENLVWIDLQITSEHLSVTCRRLFCLSVTCLNYFVVTRLNDYVSSWMTHSTYTISLSSLAKFYVLINLKWLIHQLP